MKAKLVLLSSVAIFATSFVVGSSPIYAQQPLCSNDPQPNNCDKQDPIAQQCPPDPDFLLTNDIKDKSGNVIGQIQLRWSSVCKSNWARVVANDPNAPITYASIERQNLPSVSNSGAFLGFYTPGSNGFPPHNGLFYTDMLWADGINARACGAINGSYPYCASQF